MRDRKIGPMPPYTAMLCDISDQAKPDRHQAQVRALELEDDGTTWVQYLCVDHALNTVLHDPRWQVLASD